MRGLLLLGTDTGVGKTTLACGLLRLAHRRGLRLMPFKPAETGCGADGPQDAQRLCVAAALPDVTPADVCLYAFSPPLAPSIAARLAGAEVRATEIRQAALALAVRGDALLVESAGGALTPYGSAFTAADLAPLLDIDVVLVSANRLGTISQTALAIAELRRRNLRLRGVVLVDISPEPSPDHDFNAAEIVALTGVGLRGTLRYSATLDPNRVADAVAADIDLRGLLDDRLT